MDNSLQGTWVRLRPLLLRMCSLCLHCWTINIYIKFACSNTAKTRILSVVPGLETNLIAHPTLHIVPHSGMIRFHEWVLCARISQRTNVRLYWLTYHFQVSISAKLLPYLFHWSLLFLEQHDVSPTSPSVRREIARWIDRHTYYSVRSLNIV